MSRIPLIYALHSGNLYGTERMALATAAGLANDFGPIILAPAGEALCEARRRGFQAIPFRSAAEFACALGPLMSAHRGIAFFATGVAHSLACLAWNAIYRRRIAHIHMVHGGTDERLSYGRKRRLNGFQVQFVAVSEFVRERLVSNGVRDGQVLVIENFLPAQPPRVRPAFTSGGIRRAVVVSRVDPIKRVDLLLDALDLGSEPTLSIRVFGAGSELERLRLRAARNHPNVTFAGFEPGAAAELADADLLVHLCPVEPFGLAILEAIAAGIPVLTPDTGGAGSLIEDGVSGYHFRAGDPHSLAGQLSRIAEAPAGELNAVVSSARRLLDTRFSPARRLEDYRRVIAGGLS